MRQLRVRCPVAHGKKRCEFSRTFLAPRIPRGQDTFSRVLMSTSLARFPLSPAFFLGGVFH